jgi:hypothetical protein
MIGMEIRSNKRLVQGVGVNDAEYNVLLYETVDGKWKIVWTCPYYRRWHDMLTRCYSEKCHEKYPTYVGCSVCEEWLTFSNFKCWMEQQDWENKQLDKDLLKVGNKEYNPENCVFVTKIVNTFLSDRGKARGEFPLGVSSYKGKFIAQCSNPFTGKQEYLGYFDCPEQAHLVWKKRKHELAYQLADSEHVTDERVAQALRTRYL